MEEVNLENSEEEGEIMTEQRYRELADQFLATFKSKDKQYREALEKFSMVFKALATTYGILRLIDNYMEQMVLEGPDHLVKQLVEMGRSQASEVIEETIGILPETEV